MDVYLGKMREAKLKPNELTYASLINRCKKEYDAEKALELFNEMKSANIEPDVVVYNALLGALRTSGDVSSNRYKLCGSN